MMKEQGRRENIYLMTQGLYRKKQGRVESHRGRLLQVIVSS